MESKEGNESRTGTGRMLESQVQDLKRQVRKLAEQSESNVEAMTQLMANYKMFRKSIEDRIAQMDDDGRQFERVTTDFAEGATEILRDTETGQNQDAFTAMIQQVLETDLVAREKKLREEFGRNPKSSGKEKSSGEGLGITFILGVINLVAVGYLFIHIFKFFQ